MAAIPKIESDGERPQALPHYESILLAVDASGHADRGIVEATALARMWNAKVTGAHVYAAQLHDVRFRQMEGGLPARYQREQALEHQREVHDDLITRGLSVITEAYLDQVEQTCARAAVRFTRRALEGKNYRTLATETNGGGYDLLVLGALGLGAVAGSRLGSVCQRVVRCSTIDTLVIKDPERSLAAGPLVVAVDGSTRAYGGFLTALALARRWNVPVHVVAAFDPYFHYVAFRRIAGVLSEEAGKVFRFKEQERLHEEIIDGGLAKIYEGHLAIAEGLAADHGSTVETALLDGKAHQAIEKYVQRVQASLLVIGRLGIHADPELDIGGNAERLLHNVECHVLLSARAHHPRADKVAEATTAWTEEADASLARIPVAVRRMARLAILRYAQARGYTVITERLVAEATSALCPHRGQRTAALPRSEAAKGAAALGAPIAAPLHWTAAALARLTRVPEEFTREFTRQRIEVFAHRRGLTTITPEIMEAKYAEWTSGSRQHARTLEWEAEAAASIERIPPLARGMVIKEVECCARALGAKTVTRAVLDRARASWARHGTFHSEHAPDQYVESWEECGDE